MALSLYLQMHVGWVAESLRGGDGCSSSKFNQRQDSTIPYPIAFYHCSSLNLLDAIGQIESCQPIRLIHSG
ncbi:MAG TPA: hypothetical protein DEF45_27255 [Rhodopirellula sp.]|nr:hypothetical protein [Rhodopirellula sp.]